MEDRSPLTLPAMRLAQSFARARSRQKALSHKGRAKSLLLSSRPDMRLRCRGAAKRPAYLKERGLRGTVSLRPLRKLGSLSAPRLRRYFRAHAATPYLCFRRAADEMRGRLDLAFPVQATAS